MNTSDIVRVLKDLPEVELKLIDLCWKVMKEDGSIDLDKVLFYRKELDLYIQEARGYVSATRKAIECLKELASEN
jgi:hypothetical protein